MWGYIICLDFAVKSELIGFFFKSQSFVHDSFYVRPAQVSIVDVLAQDFSTAVRGKSPHKTLKNLEQIKTIPILRCKQILLVLYSQAQIECF